MQLSAKEGLMTRVSSIYNDAVKFAGKPDRRTVDDKVYIVTIMAGAGPLAVTIINYLHGSWQLWARFENGTSPNGFLGRSRFIIIFCKSLRKFTTPTCKAGQMITNKTTNSETVLESDASSGSGGSSDVKLANCTSRKPTRCDAATRTAWPWLG